MTLDELTRVAVAAAVPEAERMIFERVDDGAAFPPMRAAVLAVLAEVKRAVPERRGESRTDEKAFVWYVAGWDACRDEMIRRLDEMAK